MRTARRGVQGTKDLVHEPYSISNVAILRHLSMPSFGNGTWCCGLIQSTAAEYPITLIEMSFGRPPSINSGFQVTPPDRGSFPLDHFGRYPFQAST
jgi:hypothetical protein